MYLLILLMIFDNNYINSEMLGSNNSSELRDKQNQSRAGLGLVSDNRSMYILHHHYRNYYENFADCTRNQSAKYRRCTIDCVYKRNLVIVNNRVHRGRLIRYVTYNHFFNNDSRVANLYNIFKHNYMRCIEKAGKVDFRKECSMVVEFDYCFNDPRTNKERNSEWVFFEGLPSNLHRNGPNGTEYDKLKRDTDQCGKEVWSTHRALVYDPRAVDMCTMACVFKRNMVFWNNTVHKENFEKFRNKVYTQEYLDHISNFYSLDRCIEMARMYYDECWSALALDICSERFIPYYK